MKVYIDCNDRTQRKEMVDYVHSKISAAEKFGRCSSVIRLGWMKKIEAVMERQEEIIEEQQERIAIMAEGGWHKVSDYDKFPNEDCDVNVWVCCKDGNGKCNIYSAVFFCGQFFDEGGWQILNVTHWQRREAPTLPKEVETCV